MSEILRHRTEGADDSKAAGARSPVELTGRVNRPLSVGLDQFRRCSFSLVVELEDAPTWYTVVPVDSASEEAARQLGKGEIVTVTGFLSRHRVPNRLTGGNREVEVLRADTFVVRAGRP